MAQTNAERQMKKRRRMRRQGWLDDLPAEVADRLARDMRFQVRPTERGTHIVDWDWSKETDAALAAYAAEKGVEVDVMMAEVSRAVVERWLQDMRSKLN